MDDQALLVMLKANLEKRNSVNDEYLVQLIEAAKKEITQEGITLAESDYPIEDANLIVMYAAHLYRGRVSNRESYKTAALNPQGMPYMLRLALNDRLFAQKMGESS